MSENIPLRRKLSAVRSVASYRPAFTTGVVGLSVVAAILEGIGISFILPIIEQARGGASGEASGLLGVFVGVYEAIGVPFTLEFIIAGVALVMVLRYAASFVVDWLNVALRTDYEHYLRRESFRGALCAEVGYFDQKGSDDILNTIITQSTYSSRVIRKMVKFLEVSLVSLVYLAVAVLMAPRLTVLAVVVLGLSTVLTRHVFESGFDVGERIADANQEIQRAVQAGTQGIREAKIFGMTAELFDDFQDAMEQYVTATVRQRRNSAGINNLHQLIAALAVFGLIYLGLTVADLSIGGLGVFLFAMFRLSPRVSTLNDLLYQIESDLPHLVRAQDFIEDIEDRDESSGDEHPGRIEEVTYDDVRFGYENGERVLDGVSFEVEHGEFVAFVGKSGAGKSTIVSLLARYYDPDEGEIRANGTPIQRFDLEAWRDRIAVVRQQPYVFNDTLRYNLLAGDREATREEMERACEIARVDEFLEDLPNGFDTELGDDGVRLSGGQRQRVALARALLEDTDVLVLDEATSDLDSDLESQVHEAIERMERDYAIVAIAHRLSTVQNADRIYTLEKGRITEIGSHEELLTNDGKYAQLYANQREQ